MITNIIHRLRHLIIIVNTPFDISRFRRARRIQPGETYEADFAAPEDVIIKKMEFYKAGRVGKAFPGHHRYSQDQRR